MTDGPLIDGFRIRRRTPEEVRAEWDRGRAEVAERWFGGDTGLAEAALGELPYSAIPGWSDLARVLEAFSCQWHAQLAADLRSMDTAGAIALDKWPAASAFLAQFDGEDAK